MSDGYLHVHSGSHCLGTVIACFVCSVVLYQTIKVPKNFLVGVLYLKQKAFNDFCKFVLYPGRKILVLIMQYRYSTDCTVYVMGQILYNFSSGSNEDNLIPYKTFPQM